MSHYHSGAPDLRAGHRYPTEASEHQRRFSAAYDRPSSAHHDAPDLHRRDTLHPSQPYPYPPQHAQSRPAMDPMARLPHREPPSVSWHRNSEPSDSLRAGLGQDGTRKRPLNDGPLDHHTQPLSRPRLVGIPEPSSHASFAAPQRRPSSRPSVVEFARESNFPAPLARPTSSSRPPGFSESRRASIAHQYAHPHDHSIEHGTHLNRPNHEYGLNHSRSYAPSLSPASADGMQLGTGDPRRLSTSVSSHLGPENGGVARSRAEVSVHNREPGWSTSGHAMPPSPWSTLQPSVREQSVHRGPDGPPPAHHQSPPRHVDHPDMMRPTMSTSHGRHIANNSMPPSEARDQRLPATQQRIPVANATMALTPGSFHPHNGIGSSGVGSSDSELLGENAGGLQPTLQPQRKRLRISRACDECRRRKTRCDIVGAFPGEPGHPLTISGAVPPLEPNTEPKGDMLILQPCMNCRRSEVTCSYSKRPLKRGPSKGYIKDLERRLNSLESQMVQGERTDDRESQQQTPLPEAEPDTGANAAAATPRLKVRTEDRISRLESVLARPRQSISVDSQNSFEKPENASDSVPEQMPGRPTSSSASYSSATRDETAIKSEASSPETATATAATLTDLDVLRSESVPVSQRSSDPVAAPTAAPASVSPTTVPASLTRSDKILLADADIADSVSDALRKPARVADEAKAKSEPAPVTSAAGVVDVAELKDKLFATYLHATFPILPFRTEDEGGQRARSVAALEDRVLARGMRLLMDPVDMTGMPRSVEAEVAHDADHSRSGTPAASVASAASSGSKAKTHAVKVAQLVGQASAGLGNSRDELALQARSDVERLRALRKIAQRLSGQEADLLMLCHLDHLRNGQSNNSALAAAVSKLGSGACAQNDRETYRRRTMLFMLDRWHAVAFGTPHLLQGRFGMERNSFRSMKDALAPLSPTSPLGDGVYEVLRAAVMLGQLDDLAQNNGGWKSVSLTDVEAVIHSATDANERDTVVQSVRRANEGEEEAVPDLLSSAALRYSLESTVRCYHALRTLPIGKDAKVEDVQRVFGLAERIVVLGTVKAPISLQGKLIQSAIGPQVLAIAGVAFSWCLRIICRLVSKSLASQSATTSTGSLDSGSRESSSSSSSSRLTIASMTNPTPSPATLGEPKTSTSTSTPASSTKTSVECLPLEHYRRKIQDYVRMCGPFCMFSGGIPTDPGSFKGVYLRLALYFNQTVGFASAMGSLVTDLPPQSPAKEDPTALASDADSVAECLADLGCLGYVLASTNPRESWRLLAF